LGKLADAQDDYHLWPDGEHGPMGGVPPGTVIELPHLPWEGFVLFGELTSLMIPRQRANGRGKAVVPSFGLFGRSILCPPPSGLMEILACSLR